MKPSKTKNTLEGSLFVNDLEWQEKTKGFSKSLKNLLDRIRHEVKQSVQQAH